MTKKRERLEVIRDILKSVREGRRIKPTRLLYSSNLSPQMFKDYVDELLGKQFIEVEQDKKEKKFFKITIKGNDFLEQYKVIESFVQNFGL
ncbi:MAG: winged helix-turn-helix domain-containing protein [Nanoarchaeota archaeon]